MDGQQEVQRGLELACLLELGVSVVLHMIGECGEDAEPQGEAAEVGACGKCTAEAGGEGASVGAVRAGTQRA